MPTIMDMSMLELFLGWLTQVHHLHIEVQFITGKWVIEIQRHRVAFNGVDAGIA